MYWETLPQWIWFVYYLFLFTTCGLAMIRIVQNRHIILSSMTIVFTIANPIVSVVNSIERQEGVNEFEYLIIQLINGEIWSIFAITGYLFLLFWWILFLREQLSSFQRFSIHKYIH